MTRLSIDTETFRIVPGLSIPRMVCATTCDTEGRADLLLRDDAIPLFRVLFREVPDLEVVCHHARFDMAALANAAPDLLPDIFRMYCEGRIRCTLLREKLLALARGELADDGETGAKRNTKFGLDVCVKRRFNIDIGEGKAKTGRGGKIVGNPHSWRLRYGELDGVPIDQWPEGARVYALDDARWNLALFDAQTTELVAQGGSGEIIPDEPWQTRGAFWLYLATSWGARTDEAAVRALDDKMSALYARANDVVKRADVLRPKMQKGEMIWTKNMKQLRERVTRAYDGHPPMTAGGATRGPEVSTKNETIAHVLDPLVLARVEEVEAEMVYATSTGQNPGAGAIAEKAAHHVADERRLDPETVYNGVVLHAVADRGAIEKVLNTYVPVLWEGTQRPICAKTSELVASGRTSYYEPNLQNPPRRGGIRECFVPRPGYVYALCDYSFVELVTLAQVCLLMFGYSRLAEAINAGLDPHLDMAADMLGIPYAEAVARYAAGDPAVATARQLAKAINFGYPGGLGKRKFVEYAAAGYGVTLTEAEAGEKKEAWYRKWPEMRRFHNHFGRLTLGDASFTLVQPVSGRVRGVVGFCDGCNCVDYETEVLTRGGWVRGQQLSLSDDVLAKDATTGQLVWQHPTNIFHYPDYAGPLVEFDTGRFSAVTTPNHRWLVRKKKGGDACVTTANLSRYGDDRIHRTGRYAGEDSSYNDDELEFTGWFLTDGSIDGNRIRIYQTKPANVERIRALLKRMGLTYSEKAVASGFVWGVSESPRYSTGKAADCKSTTRPTGHSAGYTVADYLGAGMGVLPDAAVACQMGVTLAAVGSMRRRQGTERPAPPKNALVKKLLGLFPERLLTTAFVASLSARQAGHLLDVMILGEGNESDAGQRKFYTRSREAASAVQMLAVFAGEASKIEYRDMSKYSQVRQYASMPNMPKMTGIWAVLLYRRDTSQIQKKHVRELPAAPVWCLEVPTGYFVARRAGTVYVTGNSTFQGLASDGIKRAGFYVAQEGYLRDPYPEGVRYDDPRSAATVAQLRRGLRGALYGSRIVLFLHDELILEVPEAGASDALDRLGEVMRAGMREVVPDVKVGTEGALARRWYKGAKPVKDASGRTIPWEPKKKK